MRGPELSCDDVCGELAAPTAGDRSALAAHLVGCPACSSFAADIERFDRLWGATRPVEPTAHVWDALWTDVSARLDRPEPAVLPFVSANKVGWANRGLWVFTVAQAAALLVAFSLLMARTPRTAGPVAGPVAVNVEIDPGQIVLIHGDGRVVDRTALVLKSGPQANALDDTFAMFNAVEAMAD